MSETKLPAFSPDADFSPPDAKADTDYNKLDFDNPVEFALYFHPTISKGTNQLYDWQAAFNIFITNPAFTKDNPVEFYLIAANGSGKDAFIIALLTVYLLTCRIRSRTVITTKDFKQMMNQTYPYVKILSEAVNKKLINDGFAKSDFIDIKQGHLVCAETGSDVVMFVTDEPSRAEGYHPFPDYPSSELTLIVNEAKSVDKPIFQALRRCTGYCRYICVSSAGFDSGYFYEQVQRAVAWPDKFINRKSYKRTITAYNCPHIHPDTIERDRLELEPWLFESIYLSIFSSLGGSFAIPSHTIPLLPDVAPDPKSDDDGYIGGLDLSLGGDETVLYILKNGKVVHNLAWNITDSIKLEQKILASVYTFYQQHGLKDTLRINTDVGGLGKPIYQHLRNGSPTYIRFVPTFNNAACLNKQLYRSAVTEDYFHVRNLIQRGLIASIKEYPKLVTQLGSRRFEVNSGKLKLEDKADAKSRGEKSPDHADAFVLALRRYRFQELNRIASGIELPEVSINPATPTSQLDNPDFNWYEATAAIREKQRREMIKSQPKTPSRILERIYESNSSASRNNGKRPYAITKGGFRFPRY